MYNKLNLCTDLNSLARNEIRESGDGFSGAVAEWLIATVLKTVLPQGNGGSNPSCSGLHPIGYAPASR